MTVQVQCPSCGRRLLAQESDLGSRATCPACLAEIPVTERERTAAVVQATRPARQESGPSCPRCSRDVEPIWTTCPWCQEPLRGRAPRLYGRPDIDVRRDQKGTNFVLLALAALGSLGGGVLLSSGSWAPCGAVLFLAGLIALIVAVVSKGNPAAGGFGRVAAGQTLLGPPFARPGDSGAAGRTNAAPILAGAGQPRASGCRYAVIGALSGLGVAIAVVSCFVMAVFAFLASVCSSLSGGHR